MVDNQLPRGNRARRILSRLALHLTIYIISITTRISVEITRISAQEIGQGEVTSASSQGRSEVLATRRAWASRRSEDMATAPARSPGGSSSTPLTRPGRPPPSRSSRKTTLAATPIQPRQEMSLVELLANMVITEPLIDWSPRQNRVLRRSPTGIQSISLRDAITMASWVTARTRRSTTETGM